MSLKPNSSVFVDMCVCVILVCIDQSSVNKRLYLPISPFDTHPPSTNKSTSHPFIPIANVYSNSPFSILSFLLIKHSFLHCVATVFPFDSVSLYLERY